jgi:hypothetical protein
MPVEFRRAQRCHLDGCAGLMRRRLVRLLTLCYRSASGRGGDPLVDGVGREWDPPLGVFMGCRGAGALFDLARRFAAPGSLHEGDTASTAAILAWLRLTTIPCAVHGGRERSRDRRGCLSTPVCALACRPAGRVNES